MIWVRFTRFFFGWHWVWIWFGGGPCLRRIRYAPNGEPYVKCYGTELLSGSARKIVPVTFDATKGTCGLAS